MSRHFKNVFPKKALSPPVWLLAGGDWRLEKTFVVYYFIAGYIPRNIGVYTCSAELGAELLFFPEV